MKSYLKAIFVNLTCINQIPVYFKHKSCSRGGLVKTRFIIFLEQQFLVGKQQTIFCHFQAYSVNSPCALQLEVHCLRIYKNQNRLHVTFQTHFYDYITQTRFFFKNTETCKKYFSLKFKLLALEQGDLKGILKGVKMNKNFGRLRSKGEDYIIMYFSFIFFYDLPFFKTIKCI